MCVDHYDILVMYEYQGHEVQDEGHFIFRIFVMFQSGRFSLNPAAFLLQFDFEV